MPGVRSVRRPAAVTFAALVLSGVVAAVAWVLLWRPPQYTVFDGSAGLDEVGLSQAFAADAWYLVIAAPIAFAVAVLRRRFSGASGLLDLAAALLGAAAAAYAMLWVGQLLGPDALSEAALAGKPEGAMVPGPLTLSTGFASEGWASHVYVVMLAWPLGVLAGWVAELVVPALEPPAVRREREQATWGDASDAGAAQPAGQNPEQAPARETLPTRDATRSTPPG